MHQLSSDTSTIFSDIPEQILHNHNNNNSEDSSLSIGTVDTLKRAMTVTELSDMLDCIKNMKLYAKTIEKDLPDYLDTLHIDRKSVMNTNEFVCDDFIQLAKQRLNNNQYILLNDLIEQKNVCVS